MSDKILGFDLISSENQKETHEAMLQQITHGTSLLLVKETPDGISVKHITPKEFYKALNVHDKTYEQK